jgi:signal transduction histidine kinase
MSSLQRRLDRVLLALLGGFLLQWFVADRAIVHLVESEMESRLRHDADSLLASLEIGDNGQIRCDSRSPGTIYARPYSGHYYVIDADGRRTSSASFGNADPFDPRVLATDSMAHLAGPAGQPLLVLSTQSRVNGQPVVLAVGEDLSPLRRDLAGFRLRFLALSLVGLAGAVVLQRRELRWALRTLDSIRGAVLQVQQHGTRVQPESVPTEIRPLVEEINRLLAFVERRLTQSRTAVGNLSHALKSPLAVVFRLLDDPRMAANPDLKQMIQEHADAIRVRIDRELKRARLAGDAPTAATFDPHSELPTLVHLLTRIHADKPVTIRWTAPQGSLPFDRQDLLELLGNLADNACKWAHAQVQIDFRDRDGIDIVVSDDGPGCSPEDLESLGVRGRRADDSVPGHGLGLAIARDIVESVGGHLAFARSKTMGGLEVTAHFPPRRPPAVF